MTQIRSFLGMAGYYRRFIEGFSSIAKPLTLLLKKEKKFIWTPACEESFQELKKRLTSAPVLILPDIQKDFDIYCDASRQGLGCILMQEGRVVDYASRQLLTSISEISHEVLSNSLLIPMHYSSSCGLNHLQQHWLYRDGSGF